MTDCNRELLSFPRCKGRRVEARFTGGAITSNGGAPAATDRHLGLSEQVAKVLGDPRRKASCTHDALSWCASGSMVLPCTRT